MTWPIVDNTSVLNIDAGTDSPAVWRSDGHALTERVRDLLGIRPRTVVKSTAYTVTPNDCGTTFLCDATLAAFTLSLPEASLAGNGFEIYVTKTDSKFKAVTINPYASELINGRDTLDIDIPLGSVKVQCDSVKWFVTSMSSALEAWADAFGVLPGVADCSANLNAALAELEVPVLVRTLRFRTGNYKLNNISWKGQCSLVGEGVRIGSWFTYNGSNSNPGSCILDLILPNANVSFARVTDIGFEGFDQSSTGQVCENIFKTSGNSSPDLHFHFQRISFSRCWGHGINFTNTRGIVNFHVDRVRFDMVGGYAIALSGAATNEARPFTLSKFSYDNNLSTAYESALIARGLYTTGAPWGKGVLQLKDSRGVVMKVFDGRIECNKNLIASVPGKKCLFFLDYEASGNSSHIALENITGFGRKADAAIIVYDENGTASFTHSDVSLSYVAALYQSGKSGEDWKLTPGGFSSKLVGGISLASTSSYSLALNGHKMQPMGPYDARPFYNIIFEYFKRGDVIINSSCEPGEPAFYFCTSPTTGHALNNSGQTYSTAAITTAGSNVVSLVNDPDAFRYMFFGNNITIVGAQLDNDNDIVDLTTHVTSTDPDAKTFTIATAAGVSVNPATIKPNLPIWAESGQVGYRTFNGNPYGVLPPKFIGERVFDAVGWNWYTAVTQDSNRWKPDSSNYLDFNASLLWEPGTIAANGFVSKTFAVTSVLRADFVIASLTSVNVAGVSVTGAVITDGNVCVTVVNNTAASIFLSTGTLRVRIMRLFGTVINSIDTGGSAPPPVAPGSSWDPVAGTGKTAGTPVDWAALRASATGDTITVTNTTELNAAMATAGAGDKIILSGATGTWTGDWTLSASGSSGNKLIICADVPGTWGSRTIIKTDGKISITGSNIVFGGFKFAMSASNQSNALVITGTGVELTDTEVMDFDYTSSSSPLLVIRSTAHKAHIHHCHFKNCDGMVVQYTPAYPNFATSVAIEYNHFEGTTNKWTQIGTSAFPWLDNHDLLNTGVQLRYNKVVNCESNEFKTSGNVCYRNYIEGATQSGIGLRAGSGNIVDNNYFKSCSSTVRISGADHVIVNNVFDACGDSVVLKEGSLYSQLGNIYNAQHVRCENTLVAHNTFVNCTGRDIYLGFVQEGRNSPNGPGHNQPYSPYNTWIYNNVAVGSAGVRIYMQTPNSTIHADDPYPTNVDSYHKYVNTEIKNNCNYVTGTGVIGDNPADGGTPSDYIAWNDATQTTGSVISGNIETNPNLTSIYRLQTGSPAINAGLEFTKNNWATTLKKDWDFDTRQQGAAPDMGVEEFA